MQNTKKITLKAMLLFVTLVVAFAAIFVPIMSVKSGVAYGAAFSVEGKAAYLIDYATGTVIYEKNADARLPIASMVKIMTTLLTLEAVDRGDLSLDEEINVSKEASDMGGSQIFLDANTKHVAGDLLKSVIVASANDSCVALAERIGGSVTGFVSLMNRRAKELGMNNTNFVNCTGLPAAEGFSSAKDVSVMFCEVIKHPQYFEFAHIWLEDYVHPDGRTTSMTNTNKLVRFYNGCDGGKTGFTSEAKFCLAATAKRDNMRIVAVVIGGDSSKSRFNSVSEMFNNAFGNYSNTVLVKQGENIENNIQIVSGKQKTLNITSVKDISAFMAKTDSAKYDIEYDLPQKLKAPVKQGDVIGKAYLTRDGVVVDEIDIISLEDVKKANIFDAIKDLVDKW